MEIVKLFSGAISGADFADDPHSVKYMGELDRHSEAFHRLFELLNDPANEQRLVDAETHDLPALAGIVRFVEEEPAIRYVLSRGRSSLRFRQAVGVAVKLKMQKLGRRTTGRKGVVKSAVYFTRAERYIADPDAAASSASSALEALDAVASMGDETERLQTGRELMEALAATRRSAGRPF